MSRLTRARIRKLIIQEIQKIGEDALRPTHDDHHRQQYAASPIKKGSCQECGAAMYEGESSCSECGTMYEGPYLNEGDCGCASDCDCRKTDDGTDYSIDSMLANHSLGDLSNLDDTTITPGEAFGVGYAASDYDHDQEDLFGVNANSISIDFPDHPAIEMHGHNNYMAKPSLYKVAKYAQKLLQMIPDGHELDDWQRTKIAQISDDISEVYHSLDYKHYEGDL